MVKWNRAFVDRPMSEPDQSPRWVRFGTFDVELRTGEIRKQGARFKLQEKLFQVLALLLEHAGRIVTREELRQRLWPADTFVDFDANLNTTLNKLRQAIGDSADHPRFIETIPRRGYRFIATVEPLENGAKGEPADVETARATEAPSAELRAESGERSGRRPLLIATLALLALVLAGVALYYLRGVASSVARPPAARVMLLVLPFQNLSGDPEQEYFSEGLTDEMITQLAQVNPRRLGVIERGSAMQYKRSQKTPDQISRELGVDYILEGSVRRANGRVRINAQLLRSRDHTPLWAESYERNAADVLAIQREVAGRIAQALELELLPASPTTPTPVNSEAHEAYLKGRYYWNKRSMDGVKKGIEYFQQAIQKDPKYAPAYVGLADSYLVLSSWMRIPSKEAAAKAREAATRAIEIDDRLADAHASLGGIASEFDWDWTHAEKEFRRAIELNPGYATTHQWYAELLSQLGRHDEAIAEIRKARELDPLSLMINSVVGYILYDARRYDEAIEACKKTLEMDPTFMPAHLYLSWIYEQKGMHAEEIAEEVKTMTMAGVKWNEAVKGLQRSFAAGGIQAARRWRLANYLSRTKTAYASSYHGAILYAELGYRDKAFEQLEKAYKARDAGITRVLIDPRLDPLRSDPRYTTFLLRLNLPRSDHS